MDDKENSEDEEKPPFDIHLRETARIMADWIRLEAGPPNVRASISGVADTTAAH